MSNLNIDPTMAARETRRGTEGRVTASELNQQVPEEAGVRQHGAARVDKGKGRITMSKRPNFAISGYGLSPVRIEEKK